MVFYKREKSLAKAGVLLVISILFSHSSHSSHSSHARHEESCSSQWYVTGYFTPVENDYSQADTIKINIEKQGESVHAASFLEEVRIEGWGKTKEGWYLGRFSNKWHRSQHPLNALGKPLTTGSIATDKSVIPAGSRLKIPSLPNHLKNQLYVSDDVGSAIKKTHVDIYTGEGRQAEKTTYEITGKDHTVCRLTSI